GGARLRTGGRPSHRAALPGLSSTAWRAMAAHGLSPERENLFHLTSHEEPVDNPPAWHRVYHVIMTNRPTILLRERMRMYPTSVRAPTLLIDETHGGLPDGDLRLPLNRNAANAQSVVDACTRSHVNRLGIQDLEAKPWRGD